MKGAFDWFARTAIVALSLVATLSIIGSIAAIPSGSIEQRLGMDAARQATDPLTGVEGEPAVLPERQRETVRTQSRKAGIAAPSSRPRDVLEPWLESITYALIAIAALLATGIFLLWRVLIQLRRLADAAEERV